MVDTGSISLKLFASSLVDFFSIRKSNRDDLMVLGCLRGRRVLYDMAKAGTGSLYPRDPWFVVNSCLWVMLKFQVRCWVSRLGVSKVSETSLSGSKMHTDKYQPLEPAIQKLTARLVSLE